MPYIEDIPRTHNLMKLCWLCEGQDTDFAELFNQCARLMPYGVQVRYPNNTELYEEDMQVVLKDLTKMIGVIQPKLQHTIAELEASEAQEEAETQSISYLINMWKLPRYRVVDFLSVWNRNREIPGLRKDI